MNTCTIAGRIGKSAETRTAGDTTVTGFSVAVDDGWGDRKKTIWFACSLWGERGEKLAQYLAKGTPVTVTGKVDVRTYEANGETRASLELRVFDVTLQGGKQDTGQSQGGAYAGGQGGGRHPAEDSEIPF